MTTARTMSISLVSMTTLVQSPSVAMPLAQTPTDISFPTTPPTIRALDLENVPPSYTRRDVMKHCDPESCWIIVENKVYDVTRFLRQHPGGEDIILEYAGHDASAAFKDKGHSRDAHTMLRDYYIGDLREETKFNTT